jgi:hypothetical protein
MNKTTGSTMTSETTTAGSMKTLKNKQIIMSNGTNGTSGCLYVTNVNLYLHPNTNNQNTPEMQTSDTPKVKTKCCNPGCFYYDCDILDDYYYCCNPMCYCFKPDWYYYL